MVEIQQNIDRIFELIATIPDPEIPVITIKDLGILRKVEYHTSENNYVVTITPTYTACPAMSMISDDIKQIAIANGFPNVSVELVYSPAWTTDWLSTEAKRKLKEYGIAPPNHSSCSNVFNTSERVVCPRCDSKKTELISRFGSTACKALYKCNECLETFDSFKCH